MLKFFDEVLIKKKQQENLSFQSSFSLKIFWHRRLLFSLDIWNNLVRRIFFYWDWVFPFPAISFCTLFTSPHLCSLWLKHKWSIPRLTHSYMLFWMFTVLLRIWLFAVLITIAFQQFDEPGSSCSWVIGREVFFCENWVYSFNRIIGLSWKKTEINFFTIASCPKTFQKGEKKERF